MDVVAFEVAEAEHAGDECLALAIGRHDLVDVAVEGQEVPAGPHAGAEDRLDTGHQERGWEAVAHDVGEDEDDLARLDELEVVVVATDGGGGDVFGGQLESRVEASLRGEQLDLDLSCGVALAVHLVGLAAGLLELEVLPHERRLAGEEREKFDGLRRSGTLGPQFHVDVAEALASHRYRE